MKFKESKSIYLQIADRIMMKSCKDNMPRKGVFRLSENTPLRWR